MSRMLWAVSTSRWVTVPGKMTMSDKPRIGSDSGRDLDHTLVPDASGLPPAPRMLINSVSGVVMPRVNHPSQTGGARASQKEYPRAGIHFDRRLYPGSRRNLPAL